MDLNPYKSPAENQDRAESVVDTGERTKPSNWFLRIYWNPLVATCAMVAFYPTFVVYDIYEAFGSQPPDGFRFLGILSALGMFVMFFTWPIAIGQFIVAVGRLIVGKPTWPHHAAASLWVVGYYCLFILLAVTMGYFLTA